MSCKIEQLGQINSARRARRAIALATFLDTGETVIVKPGEAGLRQKGLQEECEARFGTGKSSVITLDDGGDIFLNVYIPPPRLILIGAVHIAQALGPMANIAALDVIIVDPRPAFASPDRFAGHCVHTRWPDEVLPEIGLDPYTAVAAITHDPKIDDCALIEALNANCFYIGALGSRKTHGRRLQRLRDAGVAEDLLLRIHAPIGLNIGACGPEEIAVAILAEVINARRDPNLRAKNDT